MQYSAGLRTTVYRDFVVSRNACSPAAKEDELWCVLLVRKGALTLKD